MSKYLDFRRRPPLEGKKTFRVIVSSIRSGENLGIIYWWPTWRQYIFQPNQAIKPVFNTECLKDIAAKLEEYNNEQKAARIR